ncbi:MAG: twin-arginine translocase subunit TatC [Chloroflexi bacterium]|nr:twin-arginine translocase subunit TatC [Chloroflexota bacterium]
MEKNAIAGQGREEPEQGVMTLADHLNELRGRLVKTVIVLVITTALSFIFINQIMGAIVALAGPHTPLALRPTEMFVTYMKVAFLCGLGIGMPYVLYQMLAFLAPGLRPVEKRYIYFALPFMTVAFMGGVTFGYVIVMPRALDFLLNFGGNLAEVRPAIGDLISFISTFLFWIGVTFETPIIIFFLSKLGIVNYKKLAKVRKYAFLVIVVIAAIITPTPDPVNMMIVAIPMYMLYELGLLLARFA